MRLFFLASQNSLEEQLPSNGLKYWRKSSDGKKWDHDFNIG